MWKSYQLASTEDDLFFSPLVRPTSGAGHQMMSNPAESIMEDLRAVGLQRALRRDVPGLSDKVDAVKRYQRRRFEKTYADLFLAQRYVHACRFFVEELYGPDDFSSRDAQFERVVPTLVRIFPSDVVETVSALARLHALSEVLDTAMGRVLTNCDVGPGEYRRAWQLTEMRKERLDQIELTLAVAGRLDHLTARPAMRNSLRLMRIPARAAGLSALQRFLERGFDAFRIMQGADAFLRVIESRERELGAALFDGSNPSIRDLLG